MTQLDNIERMLAELLALLRPPPSPIPPPSALLTALREAYGTGPFTVRQLFRDRMLAHAAGLDAALGTLPPAALGRALSNMPGVRSLPKFEGGSRLYRCEPW